MLGYLQCIMLHDTISPQFNHCWSKIFVLFESEHNYMYFIILHIDTYCQWIIYYLDYFVC